MRAIILGAGKGTRLQSEKYNMPKVLRKAGNKPLIWYVLEEMSFIPQRDIYIVVGYKKEMVMDTVKGDYVFIDQDKQLGTGHAVKMAEPWFKDYDEDVIVTYGDMPLFTRQTYMDLIKSHKDAKSRCTVLTAVVDNPPAYGRIIRDDRGELVDIVETQDCSSEQLKIRELNVGMYVFDSRSLFENLGYLDNDNSQNEYYLTDIPRIMLGNGEKVFTHTIYNTNEIYGVNTPEELEFCEKIVTERGRGQ
jgi:UDP-N-acetylglucosamine diphosphorylase/glucosamine-1-phosphate N-acetyltransferase